MADTLGSLAQSSMLVRWATRVDAALVSSQRRSMRRAPSVKRIPLDEGAVRDCVQSAYLHPNESWYAPIFDLRRRSLFYLARRNYLAIDEPNLAISPALDRILSRYERRDPTLRRLPQMPDEARVQLVLAFITAQPEIEVRDALTRRFAERTSIVFGWRPYGLFDLVEPDAEGQETPLGRAFRERVEAACAREVDFAIRYLGLLERPVFTAHFT